jgi:hypothetical protein
MSNDDSSSKTGMRQSDTHRSEQASGATPSSWETPIIRDENGDPIGASLFLTAADLRDLGVSIDGADEISYQLVNQDCIQIHA